MDHENHLSELRPIEPAQIHAYWKLVRPGIDKIIDATHDHDWLPEDVYHSIRGGASILYCGFVDGVYVGFLVVTPMHDWYGMRLHIWLLFHTGGGDMLETFGEAFESIVKQTGAVRITFHSPRAGWAKRVAPAGFTAVSTIYERRVRQ